MGLKGGNKQEATRPNVSSDVVKNPDNPPSARKYPAIDNAQHTPTPKATPQANGTKLRVMNI